MASGAASRMSGVASMPDSPAGRRRGGRRRAARAGLPGRLLGARRPRRRTRCPPRCPSSSWRPERTIAWSSTMSTRIIGSSGTSATRVVPAPLAGLDRRAGRRAGRAARACRRGRGRSRASSGVKPHAVVLDHRRHHAPLAGEQDAHRRRPRVLDDVRQRLLDDAVEGRLDLVREASRRAAPGTARRGRCARGSPRPAARAPATSPKSSSALGRSSTASRRTSCSVESPAPAARRAPVAASRRPSSPRPCAGRGAST